MWSSWSPKDTFTSQLLHLWFSEHQGRGWKVCKSETAFLWVKFEKAFAKVSSQLTKERENWLSVGRVGMGEGQPGSTLTRDCLCPDSVMFWTCGFERNSDPRAAPSVSV